MRRSGGPSLAWRMAAAIALTVGFYTLSVLIAGVLLAVAILPWVLGGTNNLWVTVTCFVLGATILVAIFPRRMRFEPAGVRVTAAEQPRLLSLIEDEARATGARGPDEVYATLDANASVMQRRGRRLMFLGIPLLHLVSERGIRSVIAHEFGHYSGGDLRSGPWISRTYQGIARTIEHLTDDHVEEGWTQRAIRQPFVWYGNAFMRITAAIMRREEFAADATAAARVGRDAYADALRRIHAYAPAFDSYWQHEVIAVLQSGRRPPVLTGFGTYLRSSAIERLADEHLEHRTAAVTDRYDSHPSLGERIAALESSSRSPGRAGRSRPGSASPSRCAAATPASSPMGSSGRSARTTSPSPAGATARRASVSPTSPSTSRHTTNHRAERRLNERRPRIDSRGLRTTSLDCEPPRAV